WNNYMLPYIMLGDDSLFPITVGLSTLMNQGASQPAMYTTVITGALVSIIPLIALFLLLQRYWQSDLTGGSVKGGSGPAPRGRPAVPRLRGAAAPHDPGGLAAGDVHHRDHRGPGLDHSADRPVPAAAALLAVRSHRRLRQGVKWARPARSAILDRRSPARGRDV